MTELKNRAPDEVQESTFGPPEGAEHAEHLYGMESAAQALGISRALFEQYVYNRLKDQIRPDGKVGNTWYFTQETLDRARVAIEKRRAKVFESEETGEKMYTVQQAAEYTGLHKAAFSYHFRLGHLKADKSLSERRSLFTKETLDRFVRDYGPFGKSGRRSAEVLARRATANAAAVPAAAEDEAHN